VTQVIEEAGTALLPEPDMTEIGDDAGPEVIAGRAAQWRDAAAAWQERAGELSAEAEAIMAAAQAKADEVLASGRRAAALVSGEASALAREAGEMTERARILGVTARHRQEAVTAGERLAVLQAELESAQETVADADAALPGLQATRGEVVAALEAARLAGDLDGMTALKVRLAAVEDLAATVTARRDAARAARNRLRAPGGPLDVAGREAANPADRVTSVLDRFFPDRPGAAARNLARSAQQARGW